MDLAAAAASLTPTSTSRSLSDLLAGIPLILPLPPAPMKTKRVPPTHWHWRGVIVGRVWDAAVRLEDILLMQAGGTRRRLSRPDRYAADGHPIWHHGAARQKQVQRDLDRACYDGFEADLFAPCMAAAAGPRRFAHHNTACNAGRTVLLDFLSNTAGLSGISYFAVGTGAGTPGASDTVLFNEVFRKAITSTVVSGNQIDESTFFAAAEGNFSYTEAALFGNGATGTAGSGTIFNHASYSYNKTSTYALTSNAYIQFS